MLWLRAWLQETESHYPGPRCRDGTMLRDARLSRSECLNFEKSNNNNNNNLQIPLTNEHGDVFQRDMNTGDFDECSRDNLDEYSVLNGFNNLPPSPEESEYFYDQYIDYPYHLNETNGGRNNFTVNSTFLPDRFNSSSSQAPQQITDFNQNKFNMPNNFHQQQQNQSPFTFFGVPIPSLNIGKIWGAGRNVGNTRSQIGTRGKGRVQIYRPGDPEFSKIFKKTEIDSESFEVQRNNTEESLYSAETEQKLNQQNKNELNSYYRPVFQTPFLQNAPQTERGGFTPMMPGVISGGFRPITVTSSIESLDSNETIQDKRWSSEQFQELVPLVTESILKQKVYDKEGLSNVPSSEQNRPIENHKENYYDILDNNPIDVDTVLPFNNHSVPVTAIVPSTASTIAETVTVPITTSKATTPIATTSATTSSAISDERSSEENASVSSKKNNFLYDQQQNDDNFEADTKEELTPYKSSSKESELYDTYNHNPSSLSALVAPGAQQGIYRTPHISGRTATITKVHSPSSPPSVQIKQFNHDSKHSPSTSASSSPSPSRIYNDRFENDNNNFNTLIDEIDLNDNSNKRTNDMEWYFANYNRTSPVNYVVESGLNSYRSSGCNLANGVTLKVTLIYIIILSIFE